MGDPQKQSLFEYPCPYIGLHFGQQVNSGLLDHVMVNFTVQSLVLVSFDPDLPFVQFHDPLDDGEADPAALRIRLHEAIERGSEDIQ